MVNTTCTVHACKSSTHLNKELRFHQLPHDEERCRLWVEACNRPDLAGRTSASLRNAYICNLHFEKRMYGKKSLKKTAIPTLLLPNTESTHTQTDPEVTCDGLSNLPKNSGILKPKPSSPEVLGIRISSVTSLAGPSSQIKEGKTSTGMNRGNQTGARLTDDTPRKRKLRKELIRASKTLKLRNEKPEDITMAQFLKGCDEFLTPKLSAIVKAELYQKANCKNNTYTD